MPKAAVVMGSGSDFPVVEKTVRVLKDFGVEVEVRVISAHRTPDYAMQYAKEARKNGIEVIIAAAGKAAHLPGVLAACTTIPVIGLPVKSSTLDGLDSLLSMVQMPSGIPVATVTINGSENAALLAVQMLAIRYPQLSEKLEDYRRSLAEKVHRQDEKIKGEVAGI